MPEEFENAIEWMDGQKTVTVTVHSQKIRNRILKLAKDHPDKVAVIARPEDRGQNGYLYARIPVGWLKIQPPVQRNLTDEERAELKERAARMRASRSCP